MNNKIKKIIILDYGFKAGIKDSLQKLGCEVKVLNGGSSVQDVLVHNPDAIILSNGPGNPEDYQNQIDNIKILLTKSIPIFGICLGHQLLVIAGGGKTYKLKFGHRGNNHSVFDLESKKAYITSHNHGYSVTSNSLPSDFSPWFVNLLDNTIEGVKHKHKLVWSVQFHPEANPGTLDTIFIFKNFIEKI